MHEVSLFYYKQSTENFVKVYYLKSINNDILHIMTKFLVRYARLISVSILSGIAIC